MPERTVRAAVAQHDMHECWLGTIGGPDHLYPDCPALARTTPWHGWGRTFGGEHTEGGWPRRALGDVDPLGTDICGLCRRRWQQKQRHEEATDA